MLTMAMIAVAAVSVSADTDDEGRYVPSEGTKTYRIYFYKPAYWENEFASDTDIFGRAVLTALLLSPVTVLRKPMSRMYTIVMFRRMLTM